MNYLSQLKPRIFAVIAGINNYEGLSMDSGPITFKPLKGCVDDAIKVKTYLEKLEDFEVHIQLLLNREATKSELVSAISQHLTKAENGDVAFLYFSGHGALEYAGTAWVSEHDGMLESLVCAPGNKINSDKNNPGNTNSASNNPGNSNPDLNNESGGLLLADKELRYLINNIQRKHPHIVAVFDCCHSGENTRGIGTDPSESQAPIEKKIPYIFPQRRWEEFVFSNEISENDVLEKGDQIALPEGLHIQISACESNQSAVEVAGEGVFTKAFLSVLNSAKGNLTYYALRTRIRQYLRTVYEQIPKIYVAGGKESNLYNNFLNRKITGTPKFGEVVYNQVSGWLLNLGAVQGMNSKIKSIELLDLDSKEKICNAKVSFIKTDYSVITPETDIDKSGVYLAYTEGLLAKNFRLYLDNINTGYPANQGLLNIVKNQGDELVIWEEDENNADYALRLWKGFCYITKPNDRYRPLTIQVSIDEENAPQLILNQLRHIGKWEFIKSISNDATGAQLSPEILKIQIHQLQDGVYHQVESKVQIQQHQDRIYNQNENKAQINQLQNKDYDQFENNNIETTIYYEFTDNRWHSDIRITITNTLKVPIYCCIPYLSVWFGSNLDLLNPIVHKLEPNVPFFIPMDGGAVVKRLPDPVRFYNWPEETEYLKFIFSTDEFDGSSLSLDEMPPPFTTDPPANKRGVSGISNIGNKINPGWTTSMIRLKFPNPLFNKIEGEELAELLQNPLTADFALKLYFDNNFAKNDPSHPEISRSNYRLKPGIELIKGEYWKIGVSESELISIANSHANKSQRARTQSENKAWE